MVSTTLRLVRRPFDIVFQPSKVVSVPPSYEATSIQRKMVIGTKLVLFFIINLLIYTLPLSLAGIGSSEQFLFRLIENSLFLLIAALLTFVAFHVGILITGQSNGILRSLRVITYSTALYLATLFTLVWYTATSSTISVADDLLLFLQAAFINFILEWMGSDLVLPGEYPTEANVGTLSFHGQVVLIAIILVIIYYLYVLYVGAQRAHGTSKFTSILVIGFIILSPVLYVIGSIIAVESGIAILEGLTV